MPIYPQEINDWLRSQAPTDRQVSAEDVKFSGVEVNEGGELTCIPVVYGLRRVTGPRVYTSLHSNNSRILVMAIALSEGPISGIKNLLLNDEVVLSLPTPFTTGRLLQVNSGTYGGVLTVEFFQGTGSEGYSALITEVTGREQDQAEFIATMAGMAFVVLKMTFNDGGPYKDLPKVSVDVQGRKLRSSASKPYPSAGNVLQNANPADVLLDLLTNTTYGRGLADSKIDATSLTALRSTFETTLQPYVNAAVIKRGQVNWVMNTSESVLSNVNELCRQFGIILTLANGVYRFTSEYSTSTNSGTFNTSNIIGGYSQDIPDLSVKYNKVQVNLFNEEADFNETQEYYEDVTAQTADGKLLDISLNLTVLTNPYLARFHAETVLRKSRGQSTYSFQADKTALKYTVGDVVVFDPSSEGASTLLRIIEMTLNDDFTFMIKAVTHLNAFYPPYALGDIWTKPRIIAPTPQPADPIIRPALPTAGRITKSSHPLLTDVRGDDFYRGPYRMIKTNLVAFDNENYSLDNDVQYSTNNTANNYGIGVRVMETSAMVGKILTSWYRYSYTPYITLRPRDLANLRQEGAVVSNGSIYPKIYYVYQVGLQADQAFGWHSKSSDTNNTTEFHYFDPDRGGLVKRNRNGGIGTFPLLKCLESGATQESLFGCPRLNYQAEKGWYGTDDFAGLSGIFFNDPKGIARPWLIPNDVWASKQGFAANSASALITLKYFVVDTRGIATTLATQTINLDRLRAGDTGILPQVQAASRAVYLKATKAVAPF